MRISDWSSDVCSSDLAVPLFAAVQFVANSSRTVAYIRDVEWSAAGWFLLAGIPATLLVAPFVGHVDADAVKLVLAGLILASLGIGSAAVRERVSQYV